MSTTLGTANTAGSLSCTTVANTVGIPLRLGGTTVRVAADSANSGTVQVSFTGLHDPSDFALIAAGQTAYYRINGGGATSTLTFKGSANTQTAYVDVCVQG